MHDNNNNNNSNENTISKAKICHSSNYFRWTNLCFCMNKGHYRVLLIQLLRVLLIQKIQICSPKMIIKKKKFVKSHSLTSKWITKKINSNL